jgi:hypothetical protein
MARYKDEAGNIWEVGADGQPHFVSAASSPLAKPGIQYEAPQAAANLQRTQQEVAQTQAQMGYDTRIKRAQAQQEEQKASDAAYQAGDALGNANLTGHARYLSVPEDKRPLLDLMLSNQLPKLSGFSLGKPQLSSLMATAKAIDPTFDPSLFGIRYQAIQDFTGAGKASQIIGTADRLAANLQQLKAISDQLGGPNLGWKPLNAFVAGNEQSIGKKEVALASAYDALLPEIANQFDLFMKQKGSPTVSGTDEVMKGLARQKSQAERDAAMQQVATAIHGGIQPLKDQWNSAYGGNQPPPMWISKDAANFFSSLDPQHRDDYGFATPLAGLHGNGPTPPGAPPAAGGGFSPPPTGPTNGGIGPSTNGFSETPDPQSAAFWEQAARAGTPYAAALKQWQQTEAAGGKQISTPPPPDAYGKVAAYMAANPNVAYHPFQSITRTPLSATHQVMNAISSSAPGAAAGHFFNAATAGLPQMAAGDNGVYWNAITNQQHPYLSAAGDIGGGVAALAGGSAAADAAGLGTKVAAVAGKRAASFLPMAGDTLYGATYGAAQNPDDRLGGAVTGGLTGMFGGAAGRGLARGLGRAIAPTAGAAAPLYDAGVMPTIGQRLSMATGVPGAFGKAVNGVEQAMTNVPILGGVVKNARTKATNDFQTGVFNDALSHLNTSLPDGVGPGTEAHTFTNGVIGNAYDTARSGMQFVPDSQYLADTQSLAQKVNSGVLDPAQAKQVGDFVNNTVVGRLKAQGGVLNGDAYKAASSDIGRAIDTWSKNPNTAPMADALSEYQSIFDDAARRNSSTAATDLLDNADSAYAKFARIQRASQLGGAAKDAGTFTPVNYASAVKSMGTGVRTNAYSRGNALGQDLAQAGLGLRDYLPDSGTAPRIAALDALKSAEGLGGAYAIASHPVGLGMFAPYLGNIGGKLVAPRSATLPPFLANPLDALGNGIYSRASIAGGVGVPLALSYGQ